MNPKASNPPDSLPNLVGYDIVEPLYLGSRTAVYRAIQTAQQRPVVIKVLRNEYPSFGELVQFRNQYTLAKNLSSPGIVQPLSLESLGNSYALVMEDWGGVALGEYRQQQSLGLVDVLTIALQLADILQDLSQHQVVHKDIKPANILIHPESKQVKLIDFSIASLLPKETQEIQSPNVLEGTLAYLAPEQTGRMNRGIDYRADFYALGVTLYELLSGTLPFTTINALELVHCHIAQIPQPVNQVNVAIPAMVAAIVTKLMAKNAEDRYQSALGLKHDLQQCLTQWGETGEILAFELGQRDVSDRFLIPEKLYGRENEVQTLLNAFERVSQGSSELMLVAGFSGIGKTAIVNEVHKPITRQNGYFIKGKFDQFNRNIPLSAFVQAFRDLMGQLLSESDWQLQIWRTQILNALGDNGQVAIEVIPELERIIGVQPPATELSGTAAQNRFNLLFQKFIQVFTTPEHPLVIFLDDLQWADSASLNLIQVLMAESTTGYLLLIGAYRNNEVFAAHPLMLTLDTLRKAKATVNAIALQPLSQNSINQLISDTLHCAECLTKPLTDLVYQKTQGNPFFATQFLKALHQEKLITFDADAGYWQCDIVRVRDAALTDDVVEFMALQLQKLPSATQTVLKLAACIGAQFDLQTLAIVSEQPSIEIARTLWKALKEGLIIPNEEFYKFFMEAGSSVVAETAANPTYRFLHDRVQQAAYSLIPEDQKQATHLQIGQLLLQETSPTTREDKLFEIVNHLNLGKSLITNPSEQIELAQLTLEAGRKAKLATAYSAARQYFQTGIVLLLSTCWQTDYELSLNLYVSFTEASYLNGDFEEMEQSAALALLQAKTVLDKVKIYEIQVLAQTAQSHMLEAIAIGRDALAQLEVEFPSEPDPAKIQALLQGFVSEFPPNAIAELAHLPSMSNPTSLAAIQLLANLFVTAFQGVPGLMPFITGSMVNLSRQFGNAPASAMGYMTHGMVLCAFAGQTEIGYNFGKLALNVLDRFNAPEFKGITLMWFGISIQHRCESFQAAAMTLKQAYLASMETGDFLNAGYASCLYIDTSFFMGVALDTVELEVANYSAMMGQVKQSSPQSYLDMKHQMIQNLRQGAHPLDALIGSAYDETVMFPRHQQGNEFTAMAAAYIYKLGLAFLGENYTAGLDYIAHAQQYLMSISGMILVPVFHFYAALTYLAGFPAQSETGQAEVLAAVETHQTTLHQWAQDAPMNHLHKWYLIEAERSKVLGEKYTAIEYYDQAITLAQASQFINEQALANELAAKFYLDWGKEKVAAGYMQEAYYCYAKWGAKAKTDDLESRYPQLLQPILQSAAQPLNILDSLASIAAPSLSIHSSTQSSRSSSTSINTALDFAAILKASQSLAGTLQLDELLHQLTQIILQNSGGDRCALILPNSSGEWSVAAIATPTATELCTEPLEGNAKVPTKLIQYVKNTQEIVIIDEGKTELPVIGHYLSQYQPNSVLCLPILNQAQLVGILSVENRTTSGVFTSDRLIVLNFLCTQAAISLENARLYQRSQKYSQQIEQSLRNLNTTQSRFYNLVDNVPGVVYQFLVATDGSVSMPYISNDCYGLYEVTAEQAISDVQILMNMVHPEDIESHLQSIADSVQTLTPWCWEGRIITPSGKAKWIHGEARGAKLEDGVIVWDGLVLDISDRKAAEAIIQQKSKHLENTLQELQNAQLQMVQSEKMASLGNLVSGIAHEINNPIGFLNGSINNAKEYVQDLLGHLALYQQHHPSPAASVQGNAEDIDLEFLSEDLPKLLNSMQGATDRIKGISTSLRTFSRADTEHTVSANLHEGLESTLLILKYRLKANEVRPEIKVIKQYGELPMIDCFPGQLNQVFMNILANAIDLFDEMAQTQSFDQLESNPQHITIRTVLQANQVEIQIGDNGKGMTEEVKARIFDHLFTTKGVGKGTGLGLAIARQIVVEKHSGSIDVKSQVGKGTEFVLSLPIC